MTAKVILLILAPQELAAAIAVRLAELGGHLTGWRPAISGSPAKAYFRFESDDDCQRFVAGAREIAGVSLEARE